MRGMPNSRATAAVDRLVAELRKWTGDGARRGGFIRTVHRYGYAFVGEVSEEAPPLRAVATCRLVWRGREIPLLEGDTVIGRDADCDVPLGSGTVSRRHARIRVARGEAVVEDLGSKNGTQLNQSPVYPYMPAQVPPLARVMIGDMIFELLES